MYFSSHLRMHRLSLEHFAEVLLQLTHVMSHRVTRADAAPESPSRKATLQATKSMRSRPAPASESFIPTSCVGRARLRLRPSF
jgi:hypothetical protein